VVPTVLTVTSRHIYRVYKYVFMRDFEYIAFSTDTAAGSFYDRVYNDDSRARPT